MTRSCALGLVALRGVELVVDGDRGAQIGVGVHRGFRQAGGAAGILQDGECVGLECRPGFGAWARSAGRRG